MANEIRGFEGNLVGASSRNMLRVLSSNLSHQADVTLSQARSWSIVDSQTPGAGQTFFYLLNGSNRDLLVTRLEGFAGTAETVTLSEVTGTAVGGTAFTPKNRTAGSTRTPANGVDVQTAANITGLSIVGNPLERLNIPANGKDVQNLIERPIVVSAGSAVALVATTGAIAVSFSVDLETQVIDPVDVT